MKKNLFIAFIAVCIFLLAPEPLVSQTINEKQYKITLKPSISSVSSVEDMYKIYLYEDYDARKLSYGFDLNYKLSEYFDIGFYSAYSKLLHPYKTNGSIAYSFSKSNTFYYGLNSEFHLLPLLFRVEDSRIDIYTNIKIGMVSQYWHPSIEGGIAPSPDWESQNSFEIGLGLGVSYMFTKRIGVFFDYNFGHYLNDDNTRFEAGLKIKF